MEPYPQQSQLPRLMPRPRKYLDDYDRRQAQNERRKAERKEAVTRFTGVDGEGAGRFRNHKYVLLGVGQEQTENPDGLRFTEIMEFLWSRFLENPSHAYTGFFLGYDFTQWVKTLPEERARMLMTSAGIARRIKRTGHGCFPVRYQGWEFDMLGVRRFKLRAEGDPRWMYICDAGPFFQASFLSVINPEEWIYPVVTGEEYAIVAAGKAKRDTAGLDDDMRYYNRLENEILSRVMVQLEKGFRNAGVKLKRSQWFGPGQAAQKWLDNNRAPDKATLNTPRMVEDAARRAYYGGWFEIMAHGHIPGITYEYDINSAYPHVASRLPCFVHGEWHRYRTRAREESARYPYALVHARVSGDHERIGTMLHRCPDAAIRRPHRTAGWFWRRELDAAVRAGLVSDIAVSEAICYEPCDCPPPLRGLRDLYEARLRVGKDTPEGKAYKLLYNSMYGKFAQSVGNPRYNSYIYAGLITEGCREMILDTIATHPDGANAVVMVATDAVYFRTPHPGLPLSEKIGDWSETQRSNLTLFKPGVYWDDSTRERIADGRDPAFKSRGISAKDFASSIREIDVAFSAWGDHFPETRDPDSNRDGWYPRVTYPVSFSMITALQALQRGKWFLAGAVSETEVKQDSDPVTKRHSGEYRDGVYWSKPYDGWWEEESTPYKNEDQPDDAEWGITDDGYVKDHWFGGLR
jgi:DNA polymerase type B, organellar and viral